MGYPAAQTAMSNVHGRQVTGGSFPAEIWAKFMRAALKGQAKKDFEKPDGLKEGSDLRRDRHGCHRLLPPHRYCASAVGHGAQDVYQARDAHRITVPDLVGMSKEAALALLEQTEAEVRRRQKQLKG